MEQNLGVNRGLNSDELKEEFKKEQEFGRKEFQKQSQIEHTDEHKAISVEEINALRNLNIEKSPEEKLYWSIFDVLKPIDPRVDLILSQDQEYQKIAELIFGSGEYEKEKETIGIMIRSAQIYGYTDLKLAENITNLKYPNFRIKRSE